MVNQYGQLHQEYLEQHLPPEEFAALGLHYFQQVGQQAESRVQRRTEEIMAQTPAGSGFMDEMRRQQTARFTAREEVTAELIETPIHQAIASANPQGTQP